MASQHSRLNGSARPEPGAVDGRPGADAPAGAVRPRMNPGDEAPAGTPGTGEDVCPDCRGKGTLAGGEACANCGGTGRVTQAIGGA